MKLVALLAGIAVAWCLLAALVLGAGVLLYPAAWGGVTGVLYGLHRVAHRHVSPPGGTPAVKRVRNTAPGVPQDQSAVLVR